MVYLVGMKNMANSTVGYTIDEILELSPDQIKDISRDSIKAVCVRHAVQTSNGKQKMIDRLREKRNTSNTVTNGQSSKSKINRPTKKNTDNGLVNEAHAALKELDSTISKDHVQDFIKFLADRMVNILVLGPK